MVEAVSITTALRLQTIWESDSPLCLLVPVSPDEVGGQDNDPEAFLIPQQHHLPVQTHLERTGFQRWSDKRKTENKHLRVMCSKGNIQLGLSHASDYIALHYEDHSH